MNAKLYAKYIGILILFLGLILSVAIIYNQNIDYVDTQEVKFTVDSVSSGYKIQEMTQTNFNRPIAVEFEYYDLDIKDRFKIRVSKEASTYISSEKLSSPKVKSINLYYQGDQFDSFDINRNKIVKYKGETISAKTNQQVKLKVENFVQNTESIDKYIWDTKRKIIEDSEFNETYKIPGSYNTSLTVLDNNNQKSVYEFKVNVESEDETDDLNQIVFEKGVSSDVILSASRLKHQGKKPVEYIWDMDDGSVLTGEAISYNYNSSGLYEIELTVRYQNNDSMRQIVVVNTYTDANQISINESEPIVVDQSGYNFNFKSGINLTEDQEYIWRFDNGDSVQTQSNGVEYQYDEYGIYNVNLTIVSKNGNNISSYNTTVETEVIIKLDNNFAVTSVSGNHEKELFNNDEIGDPIPTMKFQENHRYIIKNIPSSIELIDENNNVLLSQNTDGTMEDVEPVNWKETDDKVEFTVTSELGQKLYGYRIP